MSTSFNQSTSSNDTAPVQTIENDIMNQISGVASGMAQQLYSWAGNVFQQTSQITNQAVGNFFNVSSNMLGLSRNLTDQYNNLFAPENAQLVADANSYASPARMAVDMGMAGATQAQAGKAALDNSEEALRSYGIDPSAGRYAALDQASRVQNAANVAGAENQQRVNDIATGQRLRSEAVQVGAQLPAAISNVNNTAIQANTGASNAELANANTGANLYGLADKYLGTAMGVKMPFSKSTGNSQSSGSSSSPGKGGGGAGGSGGGGAGSGGFNPSGGGPAWMPQHGNAQESGGGGITEIGGGSSMMGTGQNGDGFDPQTGMGDIGPQTTNDMTGIGDTSGYGSGMTDSNPFADNGFDQSYDPQGGSSGFNGDGFSGNGTDYGQGNDQSGFGAYGYDPSQNQFDPNANADTSGWQDPGPQMNMDPTIWGDSGASSPDFGSGGGSFDTSSAGDYTAPSDNYDPGGAYARGGAVPMRRLSNKHLAPSYAGGGPLPANMSPSGGAQTDDIPAQSPAGPARLNANEFVIPQDVALWKGQEFFQKLINQSRMARHGAPAKPTMRRMG